MSKALVVLSGGQDSVTCLFWAKQKYDEVHAVTFDYNQRHRLEIQAAKTAAALAEVKSHEVIEMGPVLKGSSPLTNPDEKLEKYESFEQMDSNIGDRRELTFVPMRNQLFLTVAANRAEVLGAADIITGVCQMDNANYDDCREVFIKSAEQTIQLALGEDHRNNGKISIITPLMFLSKAETVKLAAEMGDTCWEALAFSHTSYDGQYPPTDNNHSNVLRAEGFKEAGYPDPLVVRAWWQGLMDLPETKNYDLTRKAEKPFNLAQAIYQSRKLSLG